MRLGILLLMVVSSYAATTYYVDPSGGNDANDGLSTVTAWASVPGRRNAADNAFDCPAVLIVSGDIINIKSGSTFSGRKLLIDATHYTNEATELAPMTIQRATNWGSGTVVFDATGISFAAFSAFITISGNLPWVKLDGVRGVASPYDGITIANISTANVLNGALQLAGTSQADQNIGFRAHYLSFTNNTCFGVYAVSQSNCVLSTISVDGAHSDLATCFYLGGNNKGNDYLTVTNCLAANAGVSPRSSAGGTDKKIGFLMVDSIYCTFIDCVSTNHAGRGFDVGSAVGTRLSDMVCFNRCLSRDNASGFGMSAEDVAGNARIFLLNSISTSNEIGAWIYAGASAFLFNDTIGCSANKGGALYVDLDQTFVNRQTYAYVTNCLFYENTSADGLAREITIQYTNGCNWKANYNLYDRGTNGTEKLASWNNSGVPGFAYFYYDLNPVQNLLAFRTTSGCDANSMDSSATDSHARPFNPYFGDFRWGINSSCMNQGINLSSAWPSGQPSLDFSRQERRNWSIGAYEFPIRTLVAQRLRVNRMILPAP